MASIYSFLQKRKMHESQHGVIMVITAYVLSILMLTLGSDVFYNIDSAAAGINTETDEETLDLRYDKTPDSNNKETTDLNNNETQELNNNETQELNNNVAQELNNNEAQELNNSETEELNNDKTPPMAYSTSEVLQKNFINPYSIVEVQEAGLNKTSVESPDAHADTVWLLGSSMDYEEYNNLIVKLGSFIPESTTGKADSITTADKEQKADDTKIESFSVEVASSNTEITITSEEVTMLERIIEAEASGEDIVGKIMIANVIFNRIVDDEFPDTVEDVIFQHEHGDYQFSPVKSGRYWDVKISEETEEAVQRALEGEDYSKGALYFIARKHTDANSAEWFDKNLDWLFKHGGHEFYK